MGKTITSKENPIYKAAVRLSRRKYRDRENRYLAEGVNVVAELIRDGAAVTALLIRDGTVFSPVLGEETERFGGPEGREIPEEIVHTVSERLFDELCQTENSRGVLAIVEKPSHDFAGLSERLRGTGVVVLDRLQDPGNIGTIIRTAEGAGFGAVIAVKGTADVFSPKVVRAAAGVLARVPVLYADSEEDLIRMTSAMGKSLVVTCLSGAVPYDEADYPKDLALVIGNEGSGCSPGLIRKADLKVYIPMGGKLESLNASVAAGILMYEAARRNKTR